MDANLDVGARLGKPRASPRPRGLLARCGQVVLVFWGLDRLGRTLTHLVNTVRDLSDRDVGLRVLTRKGAQIDTTTSSGSMIFGIFATLAEFERDLIRERTMAGPRRRKGSEAARAAGNLPWHSSMLNRCCTNPVQSGAANDQVPASFSLAAHSLVAAASSRAAADGSVTLRLTKYSPVVFSTSGEEAR